MTISPRLATLSLILLFLFSLAYAQDDNSYPINSPNEAIMQIEMAKVEISKNDFVPPSQHLNAAREAANKVSGNPYVVQKAHACIIQAQIKVKQGDIQGATNELNKALDLYKSL